MSADIDRLATNRARIAADRPCHAARPNCLVADHGRIAADRVCLARTALASPRIGVA